MELPRGAAALGAVAWMVMSQQAEDVALKDIAAGLQVDESDLLALIESTVDCEHPEAGEIWRRGVTAIKTARRINLSTVGDGWDAIEAMAVEKLAMNLQSMTGYGNAEQMLTIASQANKALRRSKGEARNNAAAHGVQQNFLLATGNVGVLQLQLSPAIRAQLENPNRVIDLEMHNITGPNDSRRSLAQIEMLNLRDTRAIFGSQESSLEKNAFDFTDHMKTVPASED